MITTTSFGAVFALLFYILLIIYIIFSIIFYYHWQNYATDQQVINQTYVAYLITTVPLMLIMGISLFFI